MSGPAPGHHDWENERGHTKVTPAERESMRDELLRLDAEDATAERMAKRRRLHRDEHAPQTAVNLLKKIGAEKFGDAKAREKFAVGGARSDWVEYHDGDMAALMAEAQAESLASLGDWLHEKGGDRGKVEERRITVELKMRDSGKSAGQLDLTYHAKTPDGSSIRFRSFVQVGRFLKMNV